MKYIISLVSLGVALATTPVRAADDKPAKSDRPDVDVRQSVVQIFATSREPNVLEPWARKSPEKFSGAGVIIDGERILTNAHVVLYASEVLVQPFESGKKYAATVEGVAPGIDLAILKLSDRSMFKSHPPLKMAKTAPKVKDSVSVFGYPIGGAGLSITKGIISRIEWADYDDTVSGLRMQVDAAVNPGNSGGPAVVDDAMVGLAFAQLEDGDNIGYIIPAEEIEFFLADMADGRFDGKPMLYETVQGLENDALRERLKLGENSTGVLVNEPHDRSPNYPLKAGDVLLKIAGQAIENDGMVRIGKETRLPFPYLVARCARKDKVPFTVWRDGKSFDVDVPVARKPNYVLTPLHGRYPSYFVHGPLVFSTATTNYIESLEAPPDKAKGKHQAEPYDTGELVARGSPLIARYIDVAAFDGEELVVVTTMFPHKISEGYSDPRHSVVSHVNGTKIKNLRHLAETLRDVSERFVEIRFADKHSQTLVFDRRKVLAATEEILSDNGIRQQSSLDLGDVWRKKVGK